MADFPFYDLKCLWAARNYTERRRPQAIGAVGLQMGVI
jgi:hypothetical protein